MGMEVALLIPPPNLSASGRRGRGFKSRCPDTQKNGRFLWKRPFFVARLNCNYKEIRVNPMQNASFCLAQVRERQFVKRWGQS